VDVKLTGEITAAKIPNRPHWVTETLVDPVRNEHHYTVVFTWMTSPRQQQLFSNISPVF